MAVKNSTITVPNPVTDPKGFREWLREHSDEVKAAAVDAIEVDIDTENGVIDIKGLELDEAETEKGNIRLYSTRNANTTATYKGYPVKAIVTLYAVKDNSRNGKGK